MLFRVKFLAKYRIFSDFRGNILQNEVQGSDKGICEEPLTRQILMDLLKDYKRPNDKINELVKKGELIPIKKGFYIPGKTKHT